MKRKSPLSIFSGKQGQMYAVLLVLWQNYLQHQKDFAAINSRYTEELGNQQMEAVNNARDLPDVSIRRSIPKKVRQALNRSATEIANNWQGLSGLIESSYPQKEWGIQKNLAGYASYAAAVKPTWEAVVNLANAGTNFIADNTEALAAGGMLPDFSDQFTSAAIKFRKEYGLMNDLRQESANQTTEKANANGTIYQTAMAMMNDAKKMYRNNPRVQAGFTYSSLMKTVRGKGFIKTGCRFVLVDGESKAPVTTDTLLVSGSTTSQSGKASEKGIIRVEITAGTYSFTITAPGYTTVFGSVVIKDGTLHQKKLRLEKAMAQTEELTAGITKIAAIV